MRLALLVLIIVAAGLTGCETASPEVAAREARILQEPVGDYWIGRRVAVQKTRFWGYIRRPRQSWDRGQLVVFNERERLAPDRLTEDPAGGQRGFQFDHNREYRLVGSLSGRKVYDPNSDKILPEFVLRDYQELSADPGFLFHPREKRDAYGLPIPRR